MTVQHDPQFFGLDLVTPTYGQAQNDIFSKEG